eukprot:TRINITY_DN40394_c0_g1_i1.p1 TRINITY_DN40394_c0_g1~~TRINITY_DN40394_c0_g1_i1.p1  ORF type:complete len:464 (+),score=100.34 TRINITY_DN40394_c0_g1_i1:123-1394(+)
MGAGRGSDLALALQVVLELQLHGQHVILVIPETLAIAEAEAALRRLRGRGLHRDRVALVQAAPWDDLRLAAEYECPRVRVGPLVALEFPDRAPNRFVDVERTPDWCARTWLPEVAHLGTIECLIDKTGSCRLRPEHSDRVGRSPVLRPRESQPEPEPSPAPLAPPALPAGVAQLLPRPAEGAASSPTPQRRLTARALARLEQSPPEMESTASSPSQRLRSPPGPLRPAQGLDAPSDSESGADGNEFDFAVPCCDGNVTACVLKVCPANADDQLIFCVHAEDDASDPLRFAKQKLSSILGQHFEQSVDDVLELDECREDEPELAAALKRKGGVWRSFFTLLKLVTKDQTCIRAVGLGSNMRKRKRAALLALNVTLAMRAGDPLTGQEALLASATKAYEAALARLAQLPAAGGSASSSDAGGACG